MTAVVFIAVVVVVVVVSVAAAVVFDESTSLAFDVFMSKSFRNALFCKCSGGNPIKAI
jgi:hypothetical protein